uniref:Ubiquitin associated and SH3 domain containing B n=1 Tax=Paramormyrops kingsleyae TaxID=1676925 RepID=A0A3B3QBX3_9TELE
MQGLSPQNSKDFVQVVRKVSTLSASFRFAGFLFRFPSLFCHPFFSFCPSVFYYVNVPPPPPPPPPPPRVPSLCHMRADGEGQMERGLTTTSETTPRIATLPVADGHTCFLASLCAGGHKWMEAVSPFRAGVGHPLRRAWVFTLRGVQALPAAVPCHLPDACSVSLACRLKALVSTGFRSVQAACDWLFSHVDDPFLDEPLPREFVLYLRPSGPLLHQLSHYWQQSRLMCGKNKAHNIFPHITLCQFFIVSCGGGVVVAFQNVPEDCHSLPDSCGAFFFTVLRYPVSQ